MTGAGERTPKGAHGGHSVVGLLSLLVTYLVWGSTYLAIRVAVREGAGWGPFWLGAARVSAAAALLFAINYWRGARLRPTRSEWMVLIVSGLLMWMGGNGGVNWAETRIDSSLAALVVGSLPIWVALIEAALDRKPPSPLLAGSLAIGFAGLVVLSFPSFERGVHGDALAILAVIGGTICWSAGSILLSRRPVGLDPIVISGWQHAIGIVGLTAMAVVFREPAPHPTPTAWAAWAYLVVFGSVIAFTCFMVALTKLPTTLTMTYTYVNPVIAVALGWLILSEPITIYTLAGTVLIISGVVGVFRDKSRGLNSRF